MLGQVSRLKLVFIFPIYRVWFRTQNCVRLRPQHLPLPRRFCPAFQQVLDGSQAPAQFVPFGFDPCGPTKANGSALSQIGASARRTQSSVHLQKVRNQHGKISRYDIQSVVDLGIEGAER
jgi:hypothetical protein